MPRKILRFIPSIALFLIAGGLQLSGIQIPWLGYWLMIAGAVLLVIPALPVIRKLKSKQRLVVSMAGIYEVGDSSHWLRIKVENPTASPIQNCYGKLLDRKMVASMLTKVNGVFIRPELSTEGGRLSSEHMQLPPEGHRFPWSPTDRSLTTISISGNGGFEFLYLVTKRKLAGCFWFPASAGNEQENWSLGDFELQLEIGSESETFRPTKVRVVFRATGGDIELVSLNTLN